MTHIRGENLVLLAGSPAMSDGSAFTLFLLLLLVVALVVQSRRRQAVRAQLREDAEFAARRQEALHTRPADLAVEILGRHMPTLLAKAEPHIARDAYGVLTISPEFDGEIALGLAVPPRSPSPPTRLRIYFRLRTDLIVHATSGEGKIQ
jgi:hypothetical protein